MSCGCSGCSDRSEYDLILNHTVRIGRRSGYTETAMGDRQQTGETTVTDGASVFFQQMTGKKVRMPSGDYKLADYIMYLRYNQDCQEGDLIYPLAGPVGLTIGRVVGVEAEMDFCGATHHIEAAVERLG